MDEVYENAKEKLLLIENMYDIIRIIDPINKNIINIKNDEIKKARGKCYNYFNRSVICRNCISMRASIEKDTVIKMEYVSDKVMLIVATPVNINEETYIVEIIKDISSQNKKVTNINYISEDSVKTMIDNMNEKIIRDDFTGAYNRIYIEERLPVDVNNSIINKRLLSVIMIEIDDFKNINEKYGQDIGKKIVYNFSKIINYFVVSDLYWVGRYSGDKFIIVLNNIGKAEAHKISEQIRDSLGSISSKYNDKSIKLKATFSIYSSENEITNIKSILTELENNILKEKQNRREEEKDKEKELSRLNYRIQELRDVLNQMCISSCETADYKQTLKVSQDLDELIVEYMKNVI